MEAAKNSVKNILSKTGKHDTTVHEQVAPAVQHETINRQQHESQQVAVDREVHQHHHHTTEQPVSHQEVLPEKHHHKEAALQEREFHHGNEEEDRRRLADQASQYRSTQNRVEGERTQSSEPVVTGEHKHHHVHETIQPVIHKQTVEPHVVHTTVPVHEVHHNETKHHATSALPPMTMGDFQKSGGSLQGRDERQDFFPGEPKHFDGNLNSGKVAMDGHGQNPRDAGSHSSGNYLSNDSNQAGRDNVRSSDRPMGSSDRTMGSSDRTMGSSDRTMGSSDRDMNTSSSGQSKPSMMDKLNPKKDADGDGKAGFMK